jgi:hypothetical protein
MTTENSNVVPLRKEQEAGDDHDRLVVTVHSPRFKRLLEAARQMNTADMTTAQVGAAFEAAVPGVELPEMVEALRMVAAVQTLEADTLASVKNIPA